MDNIEHILTICSSLYRMAENVKANKERCQRVAQRAKALEELVLIIKSRGPGQISPTVVNALKELCTTLEDAKQLMMKYSQTKAFMSFLKSSSHEDKFNKINEKFTDNFQVLSGALQVEHGNILYKVYDTVAGRTQEEEYDSGQAATSPTTPMPLPYNVTPNPVSSPTAPMPHPSPMPLMPVTSPTSPVTFSSTMPPMQMSNPTTAMPVPYIASPMPVSVPIAPMSLPGTMAPIRYTTTAVCKPIIRTAVPMQAQYNVASMGLVGSAFPINMSTQSVVRGYVIKKP